MFCSEESAAALTRFQRESKSQIQSLEQQITELRAAANSTPPVPAATTDTGSGGRRVHSQSDAMRDLQEKQLRASYDKLQSEFQVCFTMRVVTGLVL